MLFPVTLNNENEILFFVSFPLNLLLGFNLLTHLIFKIYFVPFRIWLWSSSIAVLRKKSLDSEITEIKGLRSNFKINTSDKITLHIHVSIFHVERLGNLARLFTNCLKSLCWLL